MKNTQQFTSYILGWLILLILLVSLLFRTIYSTYEIEWVSSDFMYLIILWIISTTLLLIYCWKEVHINSFEVYQGLISGTAYIYWPGGNWVSPLQKFFKVEDTKKQFHVEGSGDGPAKDDKMSYSYKIFWQINIKESKEDNAKKYIKTTESYINDEIKAKADSHITSWIFDQENSFEAKRNKKDCLKVNVFSEICEEYGIRIIDAQIVDLDYSKDRQDADNAKKAMEAFNNAVDALMTGKNPPASIAEAHKIVKAKMLSNYKEYEFTNKGGGNPPILINEK